MKSSKLGDDLKKLYSVVESGLSNSGSLNCCVEFLMHAGQRSLPEAVMTMVPEAWQNDPDKKDWHLTPWSRGIGQLWLPSVTGGLWGSFLTGIRSDLVIIEL